MIKCHKCSRPAIVHLTEIVKDAEGVAASLIAGHEGKRTVEMHLCMQHAVDAGLMIAVPEDPFAKKGVALKPESGKLAKSAAENSGAGAIVPTHAEPSSLALTRDRARTSTDACPVCGTTWGQFKQTGLMGCPHDYDHFDSRLVSLLKRAQEGATMHSGKVPAKRKTQESDRQVITLRLRRELQKALHAEHYEQAAQLRDKLRQLEN